MAGSALAGSSEEDRKGDSTGYPPPGQDDSLAGLLPMAADLGLSLGDERPDPRKSAPCTVVPLAYVHPPGACQVAAAGPAWPPVDRGSEPSKHWGSVPAHASRHHLLLRHRIRACTRQSLSAARPHWLIEFVPLPSSGCLRSCSLPVCACSPRQTAPPRPDSRNSCRRMLPAAASPPITLCSRGWPLIEGAIQRATALAMLPGTMLLGFAWATPISVTGLDFD